MTRRLLWLNFAGLESESRSQVLFSNFITQGRQLRFASGGIIMANAAGLNIFFCSKTNNAGIKVGGLISLTTPIPVSAPMSLLHCCACHPDFCVNWNSLDPFTPPHHRMKFNETDTVSRRILDTGIFWKFQVLRR
jgi:hypothetical protein